MIKKVNHIAILVSDLDKALLTYQAGLGLEPVSYTHLTLPTIYSV